jgi:hypothetical protein
MGLTRDSRSLSKRKVVIVTDLVRMKGTIIKIKREVLRPRMAPTCLLIIVYLMVLMCRVD